VEHIWRPNSKLEMALSRAAVCLAVASVFLQALPTALSQQASPITLNQHPKEIKPTITKSLTITCALVDYYIKTLTSLAIFRNSVEIASVTVYSGPKGFVDKDTMTVAGNISAIASGGEAGYLSVTWQDPSESQTGNFSCEGNGLSGSDHAVSYSTSLAVVMTAPNLSDVVDFIHQLDIIDRKYKETINAQAQTIKDLQNQVAQLSSKDTVKDLQNQITQLTTDLAKKNSTLQTSISGLEKRVSTLEIWIARSTEFQALSEPYNSHIYMLSRKGVATNIDSGNDSAQNVCNSAGGYLAEIDSMAELNFASTFTRKYTAAGSTGYVWVGTKFYPSDGKWRHMTSGAEIGIPDLGPSACQWDCDGAGSDKCLSIENNNAFEDDVCFGSGRYFLCEIEH